MILKKNYKLINNMLNNGLISAKTYEEIKKEIELNYELNKIKKAYK